jgi:hypothetical protein
VPQALSQLGYESATTTTRWNNSRLNIKNLGVPSHLRITIMADQVNWQRQLTFSDRLSVTSKMQANAREATT